MPPRTPDRRHFLRDAGALTLTAAGYGRAAGSNARLRVAFLGCGARAQAHVHVAQKLANVEIAGACDVWDGHAGEYDHTFGGTTTRRTYSQGLYPTAAKCGLDAHDSARVTKDYRRLLDRADVDAVCIATPDHWHARMTWDAVAAGKHVLLETPGARTPAETAAVIAAAAGANTVVAVAAQTLADPAWRVVRDLILAGTLGPVAHAQGGAFRNDSRGQWRFFRVLPQMTPATVDWKAFVGPFAAGKPFDPAAFAQWRCDAAFSAGPFADLLFHPAVRLLAATGWRTPTRVAAAGGLLHETDGRDVPDVATVAADYPGGHLLLTATTLSNYPVEEVVRGRRGAAKLVKGGVHLFRDDAARASAYPPRLEGVIPPPELLAAAAPKNETESLWVDFVACCATRGRVPLCPAELGMAAAGLLGAAWAKLQAKE